MGLIKRKDVWRKSSLREWEGESFFKKEEPEEIVTSVKEEVLKKEPVSEGKPESTKLTEEAKNIVEGARRQAESIVLAAQKQAGYIKEEAYKKGFEEGRKEGERLARQEKEREMEEEISRFRALAEKMVSSYNEVIKKAEASLVKLAVKIAEKVIKDESSSRQEVLENMVRDGISRLQEKTNIKVRVNPEQLSFLKDKREEFLSSFEDIKGFEIVPDDTVSKGGCVVETPTGSVDLRIDKQVEEIKKNIIAEE